MTTFWVAVVLFPAASVKVQLITYAPSDEYETGSVVVPETTPSQKSVVVGVGTVIKHSAETVGRNTGFGFVKSGAHCAYA